jgi:hypothetical protein
MTNDEIQQNAEHYAFRRVPHRDKEIDSLIKIIAEDAYLAGAHSRDDEVGLMPNALEAQALILRQMEKDIAKLRYPWISVNNHLPERDGRTNTSVVVFVLTERGLATSAWYDFDDNEWHLLYGFVDVEGNDKMDYAVTHWMPIPKLQIEN